MRYQIIDPEQNYSPVAQANTLKEAKQVIENLVGDFIKAPVKKDGYWDAGNYMIEVA